MVHHDRLTTELDRFNTLLLLEQPNSAVLMERLGASKLVIDKPAWFGDTTRRIVDLVR